MHVHANNHTSARMVYITLDGVFVWVLDSVLDFMMEMLFYSRQAGAITRQLSVLKDSLVCVRARRTSA